MKIFEIIDPILPTRSVKLTEGGSMPGVGAIHIDEINPTLIPLEKELGIDLRNNALGSVGKREFSGDIDVALKISTDELPTFIKKLENSPQILGVAKSSVIMTKSGKVVYYDVKVGSYYDSDTDIYLSHDEWKALDEAVDHYSGIATEIAIEEGADRDSTEYKAGAFAAKHKKKYESNPHKPGRDRLNWSMGHNEYRAKQLRKAGKPNYGARGQFE